MRRFAPRRQRPQQTDGGRIAPVEILEDEHEAALGAHRFDGALELALHAVAGRCRHGAAQLFQLLRGGQLGQLQHPGGRVFDKHRMHGAVAVTQQTLDRFHHRPVGFAGDEGLGALAARGQTRG